MKEVDLQLLENAFLKIRVGTRIRKIFFKDVRMYRKYHRKMTPAVPFFHQYIDNENVKEVKRKSG